MTTDAPQAELDRARAGDTEALGRLLDGYRPYVRLLVRSVRRGRVPARLDDSDLVQDAMADAHRAFPNFAGTTAAEFTAWLRAVVLRSAGHALRQHLGAGKRDAGREGPGAAAEFVAPDTSPSAAAARHEEVARLAAAIARLPEDMQQVILGRHMEGLSHADLAGRLGRSDGAVRVLYTRALRRLREEFGGG